MTAVPESCFIHWRSRWRHSGSTGIPMGLAVRGLTESALREIRDSENLIRITTYTHNTMEHVRSVRSAVAALLAIVVICLICNVLVALYLLTL